MLETAFFDDMFAISEKLDVNRSVMCGGYDLVLRWIYGCSLCLKSFVYIFFEHNIINLEKLTLPIVDPFVVSFF